jgi:hypothetical protein
MMIVRVILVVWTTPVKMRPLIDTFPVNGHFLSTYVPSIASRGVLKPRPTSLYHRLSLASPLTALVTFADWKIGSRWTRIHRQSTLRKRPRRYTARVAYGVDMLSLPVQCVHAVSAVSQTLGDIALPAQP